MSSKSIYAVMSAILFVVSLAGATAVARHKTEAGLRSGCTTCRAHGLHKLKVKKGRARKGQKTYNCPLGVHVAIHRRCPGMERTISSVVGHDVACYSNLFGVESGCSVHVIHPKKASHNPNRGIGICALESDWYTRMVKNKRGPKCKKISTLADQVRCCAHLMTSTHGKYFGTVKCGNTPRCG